MMDCLWSKPTNASCYRLLHQWGGTIRGLSIYIEIGIGIRIEQT